jgi:hypothetical protein
MGKIEKLVRYTDVETGELSEKKSWVDIVFSDTEGYLARSKKSGVKTYIDKPLPSEFTRSEKGRIAELRHHLLKDNQFLYHRSRKGIKPAEIDDIEQIFKLSRKRALHLIGKMKLHGVIKEVIIDKVKYFTFNPMYGLKGKRISLTTFWIFQKELVKELPVLIIKKFYQQAESVKPVIEII